MSPTMMPRSHPQGCRRGSRLWDCSRGSRPWSCSRGSRPWGRRRSSSSSSAWCLPCRSVCCFFGGSANQCAASYQQHAAAVALVLSLVQPQSTCTSSEALPHPPTSPSCHSCRSCLLQGARLVPLLLSVLPGLLLRFAVPRPLAVSVQGWNLLSIFISTIAGAGWERKLRRFVQFWGSAANNTTI